jgi:hypothetical protein
LGTRAFGAVELLLRQRDLGLLLREVRLRLVERVLRLAHQRLGFLQGRSDIAGIHHRDDLACRHHVAFIDKKLRDAPGKLGVDVDFVGFEATISGGNAGWQLRVMLLPPHPAHAHAHAGADNCQHGYDHDTQSPPPLWPRQRLLNDGRESAVLLLRWCPQLDAGITALRFLLGHQNAFWGISGRNPFKRRP